VYTFIGVWWRKGIRAPLTAKIIIGFVWVFVILAVAIGNITHRNKQELYQSPTPVSEFTFPPYLLFTLYFIVLVLDWRRIYGIPYLGRIYLALDNTLFLAPGLYPVVLLESGQHHSQ
jgi:hypothetical protein